MANVPGTTPRVNPDSGVTGIFAKWQPQYAEQDVATFPIILDGKTKEPAIKGYAKVGLSASAQLAFKFIEIDALAFVLGKRSGIAVIDIDASDEDLLRDCLKRYGDTPFIVRTGSGGFHCYYRHGGEGREIRPDPSIPVDRLGGGMVVLPPSIGGENPYQIIRGSIADLSRLPFIRDGAIALPAQAAVGHEPVRIGHRNNALFNHLMRQARYVDSFNDLLDVARTFADDTRSAPLPDAEVVKTAKSAWNYETTGKNRFGQEATLIITHKTLDRVRSLGPYALALYMHLQLHFGTLPSFYLANETRRHMPDGEWPRRKFSDAKSSLITSEIIAETRAASGFHGAAHYKWL